MVRFTLRLATTLTFQAAKNNSGNHMDFLMGKPTVKATMKNGVVDTLVEGGSFKPIKS